MHAATLIGCEATVQMPRLARIATHTNVTGILEERINIGKPTATVPNSLESAQLEALRSSRGAVQHIIRVMSITSSASVRRVHHRCTRPGLGWVSGRVHPWLDGKPSIRFWRRQIGLVAAM